VNREDTMKNRLKVIRAQWSQKDLDVVAEALKEFGTGEDCAKYLIAELPKVNPRMILNAAKKHAGKVEFGFSRAAHKAHTRWVRKKYYAQVDGSDGERMAGITVIRRHLTRQLSRKRLERIGLDPMPRASAFAQWLANNIGITGSMVNGGLVYPVDEVIRRVSMRSAPPNAQLELRSAPEAPRKEITAEDQLAQPRFSNEPSEESSDERFIERALESRRKRLSSEKQLAEIEVQRLEALRAKAIEAMKEASEKLRLFEAKMDALKEA
jgi:hypothetical protein